jgi:hypothetical protein
VARGGEKTFLVESYVPQLDESSAAVISLRVRAAVRQLEKEGVALVCLRSFAVIGEETYLCIVAAHDLDHVVQLNERAGLNYDHVVEVIAIDPTPSPSG